MVVVLKLLDPSFDLLKNWGVEGRAPKFDVFEAFTILFDNLFEPFDDGLTILTYSKAVLHTTLVLLFHDSAKAEAPKLLVLTLLTITFHDGANGPDGLLVLVGFTILSLT